MIPSDLKYEPFDLTEVGKPFLTLRKGNTAIQVIRVSGRRRIALQYKSKINWPWDTLGYFLDDDAVNAFLEFFGEKKNHDE